MSDCQTIEPLLATYADDEVGADDRVRIAAHLAACPACDGAVAVQRQVRAVLRAQAMDLRSPAPRGLRDRVARRGDVVPLAGRRLWRVAPLSAAAALVIAITGVLTVGALAPRGTVFAAQLTLDHVKCLILSRQHVRGTPASVEASWRQRRGWSITVPPSDSALRLEFVALRRCLLTEGEVAHVLYAQNGRPVSLFIAPRVGQEVSELAIMGYETVTWTANDRTYAVVGELPKDSLGSVAAYLRANVR